MEKSESEKQAPPLALGSKPKPENEGLYGKLCSSGVPTKYENSNRRGKLGGGGVPDGCKLKSPEYGV